jgi:hypothetical protein
VCSRAEWLYRRADARTDFARTDPARADSACADSAYGDHQRPGDFKSHGKLFDEHLHSRG